MDTFTKKNTLVLANGVVQNINASTERFPESLRKYHPFNQMTKEADATHAARIFFDSLEVSKLPLHNLQSKKGLFTIFIRNLNLFKV